MAPTPTAAAAGAGGVKFVQHFLDNIEISINMGVFPFVDKSGCRRPYRGPSDCRPVINWHWFREGSEVR